MQRVNLFFSQSGTKYCIMYHLKENFMDTVKNVVRNADIWKNTKISFFKKNEIY